MSSWQWLFSYSGHYFFYFHFRYFLCVSFLMSFTWHLVFPSSKMYMYTHSKGSLSFAVLLFPKWFIIWSLNRNGIKMDRIFGMLLMWLFFSLTYNIYGQLFFRKVKILNLVIWKFFTFIIQHNKLFLCTCNKIFGKFTLISTLHLKKWFSSHIAAKVKTSVVLSHRMTTRNWNKSVEGLDFYDPIFSHLHDRSAFSNWNFHILGMRRWNIQHMRRWIKTKNCIEYTSLLVILIITVS